MLQLPGVAGELPVAALLPQILQLLGERDALVLEAPPGVGKTTLVPLALLQAPWLEGRRILMLQPRRVAVRSAAQRMAQLLGETPGQTVGYRMRDETRVGRATRIELVTEGVLLRLLQQDPTLADYAALVFDEVHERSLDADAALAMVLHARQTFASEMALRVVAMSATAETARLADLLRAPVLASAGRQYPVTVRYGSPRQPRERLEARMLATIARALADHPGSSVLAFLPGRAEIERVAGELCAPPGVQVFPLYGELPLGAQQRAISPAPAGQRKLVLATNIAETSLTIEGIDVVVDSGYARAPVFDPGTGMTRLQRISISRAAAEQRAGRAGRLRPGTCYRVFSEAQFRQLAPHTEPEISSADLTPLALQLLAYGVCDPAELEWLTPPPEGAWQQALSLLARLGAVQRAAAEAETQMTDDAVAIPPRLAPHGEQMACLPLHPRLAHLLLAGCDAGELESASLLAAALNERDPLARESADLRLRLEYLLGERRCPQALRSWQQRCTQLAAQLRRQLPARAACTAVRVEPEQLLGYLVACAYPDRIARRRHSGGYQLANGRSAHLPDAEPIGRSRWLAVAEVGGSAGRRADTIRSAAPFDPALFDSLLSAQVHSREIAGWEAQSGRFIAERERRWGALRLDSQRLEPVDDALRLNALLALIRQQGLDCLTWSAAAQSFLQRARLMRTLAGDWPDFTEAGLLHELEHWLAPWLTSVRRLADLRSLDMLAALRARLDWSQQQALDRLLPERIGVPSGGSARIDYAQSSPVLAVKLQEMFGCEQGPMLADGRVPLVLHLLSPAGRPLQITRDLASFWRNGYTEVRKEMQGRYPRHPWPEDPVAAIPTRHTKSAAGRRG